MTFHIDDDASLCSIEILTEAVEMAFVPGVLELRTLRDALHDAMATKSADAVLLAYSAFSRVDREFRHRITHHALSLATIRRHAVGAPHPARRAS
ncbi:hypothetical protein [Azospirillum doebereinerae]|uniref:Uncharacterized protein n=1 Tax=Azospirillum doebereinerae TaxID=92933 RepID=A0A433J540_9PROT|nr:hypothetical protein [Azospirillum doebereinerae]RUQ67567.1 hypothetical protein EJ913_20310 [Azospirillum doebereinerae]